MNLQWSSEELEFQGEARVSRLDHDGDAVAMTGAQ